MPRVPACGWLWALFLAVPPADDEATADDFLGEGRESAAAVVEGESALVVIKR